MRLYRSLSTEYSISESTKQLRAQAMHITGVDERITCERRLASLLRRPLHELTAQAAQSNETRGSFIAALDAVVKRKATTGNATE
jgi:hypothetical protein